VSILIRTLLVAAVCLLAVGAVASAEPAQQASPTATPAAAATAIPVSCVSSRQGVQIVLQNPQPGDTLLSGTSVVMSGIAYDPASTSGPGILSVRIYLGDRSAGGLNLGTATLGQPNPQAAAGSQFASAGFTLRTPTLPAGSGGRSIFVYAQSAISPAEGVLEVPVFLNAAPTPVRGQVPTPVLPPPPPCTPTPVPVPTATSTPTAAPGLIIAPPPTVAPSPTPFPTLALPAPGAPAAPAPAAPPAVPKPQAAAPAPAAAPATAQTTAPGGGGVPSELGLAVIAAGTLLLGGGWALRRRDRRSNRKDTDTTSPT
jgi:hypothetical protein